MTTIKTILDYARANGIAGSDEEILNLTVLELSTMIALNKFDNGAKKFTDKIMKSVKGKGSRS